MVKQVLAVAAAVGLMALAPTAQAAVITASFDQTKVAGFSAGPFGTVTVTDITGGVTVDVMLASGYSFVSTGNKSSFAFNLSTSIAASQITNIMPTGKYTVALLSQPATPYGNFSAALNVSAGNGGSNAVPPPLDFKVTGITTANFIANAGGYYFAADLVNASGTTGSVAASQAVFNNSTSVTPTPVPEPASIALLGLSLTLAGFMRSPRKARGGSNA